MRSLVASAEPPSHRVPTQRRVRRLVAVAKKFRRPPTAQEAVLAELRGWIAAAVTQTVVERKRRSGVLVVQSRKAIVGFQKGKRRRHIQRELCLRHGLDLIARERVKCGIALL